MASALCYFSTRFKILIVGINLPEEWPTANIPSPHLEVVIELTCFIFKLLMRLIIPSIAIGSEYLLGYLEFCGYLTPVFNGGANLIYDFGCFLLFQHVVTASGE